MTLNDSWGYHRADDNWKTPKTIVNNLITCAHGGGNYLLNIGPKPDGSIPRESIDISANGREVDSAERRGDLRNRKEQFRLARLRTLHSTRKNGVCTHLQLAGRYACRGVAFVLSAANRYFFRRFSHESQIRQDAGRR